MPAASSTDGDDRIFLHVRSENDGSRSCGWVLWSAHRLDCPRSHPEPHLLQHDGTTVVSIHRIDSGTDEWVPHVIVEDIEDAVADATQLGATLIDQHDIAGVACIATLRDLEVRETSFEPIGLYRVFEQPPTQEGGLSCEATMARACECGGEDGFVHTVPKHGRIGMIVDPCGAALWLRGPVPAA